MAIPEREAYLRKVIIDAALNLTNREQELAKWEASLQEAEKFVKLNRDLVVTSKANLDQAMLAYQKYRAPVVADTESGDIGDL
jgi:hypothetical protein